MKPFIRFAVVGLMALCAQPHAQERSASGATDLQSSWTALHTLATSAGTKADTVGARVDKIVTCNLKAMLYAPGSAGADTDGCIDNIKLNQLSVSVDTINTQLGVINNQITTINSTIASNNTKIDALQANVVTLQGQISSLSSKANDLSSKANDAAAKIADLNNQVASIASQLSNFTNQINTHTAQIADLYSKIPALNTSIASINSSINNLNSSLGSLNGTVGNLNNYMTNGVLACGAANYIYNYNVGCVIPTTHHNCVTYAYATNQSNYTNCGSNIPVISSSSTSCTGNHNSGTVCTTTTKWACYAVSCS